MLHCILKINVMRQNCVVPYECIRYARAATMKKISVSVFIAVLRCLQTERHDDSTWFMSGLNCNIHDCLNIMHRIRVNVLLN